MQNDPMTDFEKHQYHFENKTKTVYRSGHGPAVIIMAEMPGISPHVTRFARWIRDAGFCVWMPSLFGRDGEIVSAQEGAAIFQRACVSAEFHAFAQNGSSPITSWLKQLARHAHKQCGGAGVGAIGMCFTGNFALSMTLEPAVIAPVVCQPALPLDDPAGVELSDAELDMVAKRLDEDDLHVLAYRFEGDRFCAAQRFETYRQKLGARFLDRTLPNEAANQDVPPFFEQHVPCPHSVLTVHLIDEEGQPTLKARDEVIAFFTRKLH